jgi:aminoglycoside phosphotransferase (APT) family kinase protein
VGRVGVTAAAGPGDRQRLEGPLTAIVGRAMGAPVTLRSLQRLKGGYSREIWSFDAEVAGQGVRPLIFCADNPSGVVGRGEESLGRTEEARLLTHLGAVGLPVPGVLCSDGAASEVGRPYLVVERVEGLTAVGPLLRDPRYEQRRDALAGQLAGILGDLQRAPLPAEGFAPGDLTPDAVAGHEVERWSRALASIRPGPGDVLGRAAAWLARREPPRPERVVMVHGDYRTGNVVYGLGGIRAVLDWEMAHPGDPVEDVVWAALVCWRIGTPRVGGLVAPERWFALCSAATGQSYDSDAVRFWEVLASVKIGVLTRRAIQVVPEPTERALLRRLAAQVEADLADRLLR